MTEREVAADSFVEAVMIPRLYKPIDVAKHSHRKWLVEQMAAFAEQEVKRAMARKEGR